jgi:hypothetical protein
VRLITITATSIVMLTLSALVIAGSLAEKRNQDILTNGDPKLGYVCLDWHCGSIKYCHLGDLVFKQRYRFVRAVQPERTIKIVENAGECK